MRGNEWCAATKRAVHTTFPIPMRGNENRVSAGTDHLISTAGFRSP